MQGRLTLPRRMKDGVGGVPISLHYPLGWSKLRQEMAETGYERASTKSIAVRAAMAPGLVHYHFASKEAVLLALVEVLIESAEARFAESAAQPARERLVAFVATRVGRLTKARSQSAAASTS